jgi:hypothetical protein
MFQLGEWNQVFVPGNRDWFKELKENSPLELVTSGRWGGNVVKAKDKGAVPLFRTTSCYQNKNQLFSPVHFDLLSSLDVPGAKDFNTGLVEVYNNSYRSMKFHTDQSLDLAKGTVICVCTFYSTGFQCENRKLTIKNKTTGQVQTIPLLHNSAVWFDEETNRHHVHQITLHDTETKENIECLLVTLRTSKTKLDFHSGVPVFLQTGKELTLATKEEQNQMYQWKGLENKQTSFEYPDDVSFTLNSGDLLSPFS